MQDESDVPSIESQTVHAGDQSVSMYSVWAAVYHPPATEESDMVARNDTFKRGSGADPAESSADCTQPSRRRSALEQTIEAERTQLLQAQAVLTSLYEVLLHADHENAVSYAEAAHLAARLIDDSVARLTSAKLQPMIEALSQRGPAVSRAPDEEREPAPEMREPRPVYM